MTPNSLFHRVPGAVRWLMGCLAAIAFAGAAIPVQAATATLSTGPSCTYTAASVDANGNLLVTCNTTPQPGQIAFQQTTYSANISNPSFNVAVVRNNGTVGAVGATVSVTSGGCTVGGGASTTVSFADGSSAAQNLVVATPAALPTPPSCTLALSSPTPATGGPTLGGNATINLIDPNAPGTFAWASPTSTTTPGTTPSHQITISRIGGSNGEYDVYIGVASTNGTLTNPVIVSPVKFLNGETSKTTNFTPGTTAGTITFNFLQVNPVAPTTAPSSGSGTHQVTVSAVSGCAAPGQNVTVLATPSPNTGTPTFSQSVGKIIAIPMPIGAPNTFRLRVFNTSQTDASLNTTIALSQCPGQIEETWWRPITYPGGDGKDSGGTTPCRKNASYTGNSIDLRADVPPSVLGLPPQWQGKCGWLTADRPNQWYFNIRVDNCNSGSCQFMYQIDSSASSY